VAAPATAPAAIFSVDLSIGATYPAMARLTRSSARVVDSDAFNFAILGVIVANAVLLALDTYDSIAREAGGTIEALNDVFLWIFVVELCLRFIAVSANPARFFRSGWNVFDFLVVAAAFVPGLRENATLLRLARLLRVVRVFRLLPDLRVFVVAVGRSLPAVGTLAMMTLIVLFLYGMVGWVMFDEEDPSSFGDIGQAMLTMFIALTLENLPDLIERGAGITDWAYPFYISFALLAAFLLFNLFIGIVINSLEEARAIELQRMQSDDDDPHDRVLAERMRELRRVVDELEREVASRGP
jgi:voltage-gated sodium channel